MARVFTFEEKLAYCSENIGRLRMLRRLLLNVQTTRDRFIRNKYAAADINTRIQDLLDESIGITTNLGDTIALWNATYEGIIYPGMVDHFTHLNIDVTNVAAGNVAVLTADGGTPFAFMAAWDNTYSIRLRNCENPENNGLFAIHATTNPTNTVITLNTAITGGIDNTYDTHCTITLETEP